MTAAGSMKLKWFPMIKYGPFDGRFSSPWISNRDNNPNAG